MEVDTEYAAKVAKINDGFRDTGFGVTLTVGVQALEDIQGLMSRIRSRAIALTTPANSPNKHYSIQPF